MKTDNQLQQDVTAELQWEPSIHAARIGVEVGTVHNWSEREVAATSAWGSPGVHNVVDMLKLSY